MATALLTAAFENVDTVVADESRLWALTPLTRASA